MTNPSGRVVVVGTGNVGASIAYAILNQETAKEILLVDIAEDLAKAQALDMQDAQQFTHGTKVRFANYSDIENGDIIVITCGIAQKEGQTRQDLLKVNASIIRSVIKSIKETNKEVFIVMVTNPVDVLTYIAATESGLPEGHVFGSGTYLDSGRLRQAIAEKIDVNHNDINALILGEHGDTSFPFLSSAKVNGFNLDTFIKINDSLYGELMTSVREKAYKIIEGKKSTYYGIGNAVAEIVRVMIRNEKRILPLSVLVKGQYGAEDVSIGIPAKLGSNGYEITGEVELTKHEKDLFDKSVDYLKENINLVK